nr:hypothetical protein [Tanacetum cinerariifolium]
MASVVRYIDILFAVNGGEWEVYPALDSDDMEYEIKDLSNMKHEDNLSFKKSFSSRIFFTGSWVKMMGVKSFRGAKYASYILS